MRDRTQAADQQGCIEAQVEADTFAPTNSDIGYVGELIASNEGVKWLSQHLHLSSAPAGSAGG